MEDPFCYFYRNTGKIVYKNRNIIRDIPDSNLNRQNCEMVHSKNIYTDGNSYYYLTELYTENLSPVKNRYLKWQQTRKKDWDWFNVTINPLDLLNIQRDTSKIQDLIYRNRKTKLQYYNSELIESIRQISDKYKVNGETTQQLIHTINLQLSGLDGI
jgi:hypothetical protein